LLAKAINAISTSLGKRTVLVTRPGPWSRLVTQTTVSNEHRFDEFETKVQQYITRVMEGG